MPRKYFRRSPRSALVLVIVWAFAGPLQIVRASESHTNWPQATEVREPGNNSPAGVKQAEEIRPESGAVLDNTYSNSFFGFKFSFPKGWSVGSGETKRYLMELGEAALSAGDPSKKAVLDVAAGKTHPLLIVFQHPFGTPTPFNPAIIVYAEDVSYAPGIQDGQDFLLNERMHLTNKPNITVLREPTPTSIGGSEFYRMDLSMERPAGSTAFESSVVTIRNGYALCFNIVAGSPKQLDELEETLNTLEFQALPKEPESNPAGAPQSNRRYGAFNTPGISLLTPTGGVNFDGYLSQVLRSVKTNWYGAMPDEAWEGRKGITAVTFRIERDGTLGAKSLELERSSGNDVLDKAAMDGIRDVRTFSPLPEEFKGDHINLRFIFFYNIKPEAEPTKPPAPSPAEGTAPQNRTETKPATPQQ